MQARSTKYDRVTIFLHWVIGIGILLVGGIELVRHEFPKGHFIREGFKSIHQPAGTVLLALIFARLVWRMTMAQTPGQQGRLTLADMAAKFTHVGLYVLMAGVPLVGLISVLGSGKAVPFGAFELAATMPAWIAAEAKPMRNLHEAVAQGLLALALLHAAAALAHHYLLRDGVLARMWPGTAGRASAEVVRKPMAKAARENEAA